MTRIASSPARLAVAALLPLCLGCVSRPAADELRGAVIGEWRNLAAGEGALGPFGLGVHQSPYPERLVFHDDGRFEAHYSEVQLERLRRRERAPELPAARKGTYDISVDWLGVAWIDMDPGAPSRRITLSGDRLVLHGTDDTWSQERYERAQGAGSG
jgi:hypothetical protein